MANLVKAGAKPTTATTTKKTNLVNPKQGLKPSIKDELKNLAAGWGEIEVHEGFGEVPEGKYTCLIKSVVIGRSKKSERLQASFDLVVAEGEFVNRHIFKHDGLETAQNLSFMRTTLHRLGIEWPASPEELPETLADLAGTYCEVQIKEKGEFMNCYINKAISADEVTDETASEEGAETTEEETTEEVAEETAPDEEAVEEEVEIEVAEDEPSDPTPPSIKDLKKPLLPGQVKELQALCKQAGYKITSKVPSEVVIGLGLYCGLSGEFVTQAALLAQIKAALN